MFWNRHLWKWVALAAGVLGALAAIGDLIWVGARYWYVSGPLLLAFGALVYWGLGPSKDAAVARGDEGQPLPPPPPWQAVLLRLAATALVLVLGLVVLGAVIFLGAVALDNLVYVAPALIVAAILAVMAVWPARKAKPIVQGEKAEKDIVS